MEFKRWTREIEVNGHKVNAEFVIEVSEDDIDPKDDFDFGNEQENTAYLARFRRGELFVGVVLVRATALGMEGTDVLGGCHLHCNNMFNPDPFNEDVNSVVNSHGMPETAEQDLINSILDKANQLKKFAS